MKKLIIVSTILYILIGCGGLKGLVAYEPFTTTEISLFDKAFDLYSKNDNNGEMHILKEKTETLLIINGNYPAPNNSDKFSYQYTKEKGLFVFRSYKNDELFEKTASKDFKSLLNSSLKISL